MNLYASVEATFVRQVFNFHQHNLATHKYYKMKIHLWKALKLCEITKETE